MDRQIYIYMYIYICICIYIYIYIYRCIHRISYIIDRLVLIIKSRIYKVFKSVSIVNACSSGPFVFFFHLFSIAWFSTEKSNSKIDTKIP